MKMSQHIIEQLQENEENYSVIEHLGLSKAQVLNIVLEWYTNGLEPLMFVNRGEKWDIELDEHIDSVISEMDKNDSE